MKVTLNELITVPRSIKPDRRQFIGGTDARTIMSPTEAALIRLWREKRGETEPEDFANLIVQLGVATEALNRTSRYFNWIPLISSPSAPVNAPRFPLEIRCPQLLALSAHRAELTNGLVELHQRSRNVEWWGGSRPPDRPTPLQ